MNLRYFKFKLFGTMIGIRVGCNRVRYKTYDDARKEAGNKRVRIYRCDFCGDCHIQELQLSRREICFESQNYRCADCGARHSFDNPLTIHHIKARAEGGTNSQDNLVGLCRRCHTFRHKPVTKRQKREAVREYSRLRKFEPDLTNQQIREQMIAKWSRGEGIFGQKLNAALQKNNEV